MLRAAGLPWDLRKTMPYCGYETFDFEVPTQTEGDCFARYLVRMEEMRQSCNIVEQALDRWHPARSWSRTRRSPGRRSSPSAPTPGQFTRSRAAHHGPVDGSADSPFQAVTEGFRVPPGQVYHAIESPRGELGCHLGLRRRHPPVRVHVREPSFISLQSIGALVEGGMIGDADRPSPR